MRRGAGLAADARRPDQGPAGLFNLLSNATKFTENGTMRLRVERDEPTGGRGSLFRVSDTGIGMTPEQLAQAVPAVQRRPTLHHPASSAAPGWGSRSPGTSAG